MADAMTYRQAVKTHGNALYDVVALLDAAVERIDAATSATKATKELSDSLHSTLRLVQMAKERSLAAAEDLGNCT
jgi:hypothetical protein